MLTASTLSTISARTICRLRLHGDLLAMIFSEPPGENRDKIVSRRLPRCPTRGSSAKTPDSACGEQGFEIAFDKILAIALDGQKCENRARIIDAIMPNRGREQNGVADAACLQNTDARDLRVAYRIRDALESAALDAVRASANTLVTAGPGMRRETSTACAPSIRSSTPFAPSVPR